MLEVNGPLSVRFAELAGTPLPQLPGLVAADIKFVRRKIREELVVKRAHEIRRCFAGSKGSRDALHFENGVVKAVRTFRQRLVCGVLQPAFDVPEGIQIRDEFNAVPAAQRIQLPQLPGGQRRGLAPNNDVIFKRIRMFDVKLELVIAQLRQKANQRTQSRHRRHTPAGNIKHESADGNGGAIFGIRGVHFFVSRNLAQKKGSRDANHR